MPRKSNSKQQHGSTEPFAGFALPTSNTTYAPNQFFDVCLPHCSRGAVRVVSYLIRRTLGWSDAHGRPLAEQHQVTFGEFVNKAGISRDMVKAAVDEAIAGHFIRSVRLGAPNSAGKGAVSAIYELCWDERSEYVKDPKRFRGFFAGEGNRTYIPNQFFDVVIPNQTLAVVKVVGSVIRFSIGFQTKWGHRRQLVSLSYQDMQNYSHLADRKTLAAAIKTAIANNFLTRVEAGFFDRDAGKLSRAATYAVKWHNQAIDPSNGQKTPPGNFARKSRSENPTGNGQKSLPDERSENPTDIQITMTNKTLKQQETFAAVAFERLKAEGFDAAAAQAIASRFDANRIARQIEWIDSRQVRSNRLGMLRTAIEQNWSAPQRRKLGAPNPEPRQGTTFEQAIATSRRRFRNQTTS